MFLVQIIDEEGQIQHAELDFEKSVGVNNCQRLVAEGRDLFFNGVYSIRVWKLNVVGNPEEVSKWRIINMQS